jgi:hypothetical protein
VPDQEVHHHDQDLHPEQHEGREHDERLYADTLPSKIADPASIVPTYLNNL